MSRLDQETPHWEVRRIDDNRRIVLVYKWRVMGIRSVFNVGVSPN